jgi:hypothetical protein
MIEVEIKVFDFDASIDVAARGNETPRDGSAPRAGFVVREERSAHFGK